MTPLFILDALQRRLKDCLGSMKFLTPDGTEKEINCYQMALPAPTAAEIVPRDESDENYTAPTLDDYIPLADGGYTRVEARRIFPCVIIRPLTYEVGDLTKREEEDRMTVIITVGVFESSDDNAEGGKTVVAILERIRQSLESKPVLEQRYECGAPMYWELMDSETRPFWFGEMALTFTVFKAARLFDLGEDFRAGSYPAE